MTCSAIDLKLYQEIKGRYQLYYKSTCILNSFDWSISVFLYGYSVWRTEPASDVFWTATKEKSYFVQSFHVWHLNKFLKNSRWGFRGITNSEFAAQRANRVAHMHSNNNNKLDSGNCDGSCLTFLKFRILLALKKKSPWNPVYHNDNLFPVPPLPVWVHYIEIQPCRFPWTCLWSSRPGLEPSKAVTGFVSQNAILSHQPVSGLPFFSPCLERAIVSIQWWLNAG